MSRSKFKSPKPSPAPARTPGKFTSGKWLIAGAILGVLAAGIWLGNRPAQARPPAVDLSKADAAAAATIRKHLEAVTLHPESGLAWGQLGAVLRAYEFSLPASQCLAEAERLDPANARWPYFQSLLAKVEAPEEAIRKLRQTIRLCGNNPPAPRFRLSLMLAEAGRWDEAKAELDALLQADPQFAPARLLLARRAQALGDLPEAIALARRCTDDARTARGAWTLLASLHTRRTNTAEAAEAGRKAAAAPADAQLPDPYESEATLLRGDPRLLSNTAHSLLAAGQLAAAAPLIDRLVKEHPTFSDTWLLLGRYQLLNQQPALAEQSLRHHLELDPQSTQGLFQLGSVFLNQNRFPEAAEAFEQATRLKPDFGPAFFNRGFALARAGQLREAVPAFKESLRHNPEHLESYFLLADLLQKLGEPAEARRYLDTARALKPDDARFQRVR